MSLRGTGLLAIWNGMEPGWTHAFLRWHVGEHLHERLSVPGFLRARRYRAVEGVPEWFNFYEVESPEVLSSLDYLDRLNTPSTWTQEVVPHFTDVSRTLCRVAGTLGHGAAGFVWAIRLASPVVAPEDLLERLIALPDVSAAHLVARHIAAAGTSESAMRGAPDGSSAAILLVEGPGATALTDAIAELTSDAALTAACGAAPTHRGLYQLDYLLDAPDAKH